jgi:hypothetical protein
MGFERVEIVETRGRDQSPETSSQEGGIRALKILRGVDFFWVHSLVGRCYTGGL